MIIKCPRCKSEYDLELDDVVVEMTFSCPNCKNRFAVRNDGYVTDRPVNHIDDDSRFMPKQAPQPNEDNDIAKKEMVIRQGSICPHCGAPIDEGDTFCTECGKRVDEVSQTTSSEPAKPKCPHCGAPIDEGDIFCTECGKRVDEVPQTTSSEPAKPKCPHCGAIMEEGDVFCTECGKRIDEVPKVISSEPAKTVSSHRESDEDDNPVISENSDKQPITISEEIRNVEVQANEIDRPEEYGNIVGNEIKTRRNKVPLGISIVVIIFIMGTIMWNYYSSKQREEREIALADSLEQARKDSLEQVRLMEIARLDSINKVQQEEKEFLEKFFKNLDYSNWDKLDSYVRKHITRNALQNLRDGYEYDNGCVDCLALWMFSYRPGGGDLDKELGRKIEQVSDNTFVVTTTWGDSEDSSIKSDYKVRLSIVKEGDSYKIDTIVNVEEEEFIRASKENANKYSNFVGKWRLRKTTGEGQMVIEIILKGNHSGELATFNDRGNVTDIILYEQYPLCILEDGVIYMTKNGDINGKGVPKLRVASDGLYSFDGDKYIRQSE